MHDGTSVEDMLERCGDYAVFLSSWENDFVADLTEKLDEQPDYELTDRQLRKLHDIYKKVQIG